MVQDVAPSSRTEADVDDLPSCVLGCPAEHSRRNLRNRRVKMFPTGYIDARRAADGGSARRCCARNAIERDR